MSNRVQERVAPAGGGGIAANVNISGWSPGVVGEVSITSWDPAATALTDIRKQAGTDVYGPITAGAAFGYPITGLFSTASVLFADNGAGSGAQPLKVDANTDGLLVSGPTTTVAALIATQTFVYVGPTDSTAITAVPALTLRPGTKQVTFWVTYTQGVGSSAPYISVYPVWGNGTSTYRDVGVDPGTFPSASREATFGIYNSLFQTAAVPSSATPMTMAICLDVPAGATTANLVFTEHGGSADPGTIAVDVTTG